MADVSTWSTTPGSNNSSPPDGWPEAQAPSTVNDCARQMMAELSEWYLDTKGSLTSTGAANAYVLATNTGHATLAAQSLLAFRANFGNTGAATLAVDGLAAKNLRIRGAALASGDIVSGSIVLVSYNATDDVYDCHVSLPNNSATNLTTGSLPDARLSANVPLKNASNTFSAAAQIAITLQATSDNAAFLHIGTGGNNFGLFGVDANETLLTGTVDGDVVVRAASRSIYFSVDGGTTKAFEIDTSGNFDFKAGTVLAAAIANSDSETLVAGQLHFIDGNATLPNLTAGQWVQVINDSASPITISKHGSDTTYWSATGATVSTSFTLAARGKLTAACNPAGSSVYVSGSGITAAT